MKLNSFSKKFVLAILIAFGGVVWLNVWHRLEHDHGLINSMPVSNWLGDSLIVLLPIMLAVWGGLALSQRLIDRSSGRMHSWLQTGLKAAVLNIISRSARAIRDQYQPSDCDQ